MEIAQLILNGTPIPVPTSLSHIRGGLYGSGSDLISLAFTILTIVGIIFAMALIIYSGIQWVMSGGEKQALQNARNRLTYSIVGLVVIIAAFLIVRLVITLVGGKPDFFLKI